MTYYEKNKERIKAYASARWFRLKQERNIPVCRGAVNYNIHNFCAMCRIKYSKDVYRCKSCNHKVRTKAWAGNYGRNKRY